MIARVRTNEPLFQLVQVIAFRYLDITERMNKRMKAAGKEIPKSFNWQYSFGHLSLIETILLCFVDLDL